MNPYKSMGDLYDFEYINKYQGVLIGVLPAHVFGIGECLIDSIHVQSSVQYSFKIHRTNTFQQPMKSNEI